MTSNLTPIRIYKRLYDIYATGQNAYVESQHGDNETRKRQIAMNGLNDVLEQVNRLRREMEEQGRWGE